MHHKTAEAFAGGQSLQVPMVREVLHCYQQSQRVDDPHAYCWFKTVFRFDLTVTTYTIDDASKSLLFLCRLAAPRACGFMRNSLGISHSKSTRHSCVPAHAGVHDSPISPSGRTRHML